jgi:hypothetical protein
MDAEKKIPAYGERRSEHPLGASKLIIALEKQA